MGVGVLGGGRLLFLISLDVKDELEERLERCMSIVILMIVGVFEREVNDVFNVYVCKGFF